jgi:hypothetical protein
MLKTSEPSLPTNHQPPNRRTHQAGTFLAGVNETSYLGPATVMEINERERLVLVQWHKDGQPCLSWARPALVTSTQFNPGDEALVLSQNMEDFYLIGLLGATAPAMKAAPTQLLTQSGASVAVSQSAGEEIVQVHSKQGALVFEYHPESGKTVVNIQDGDLEFSTRNGGIAFHSAKDIRINAPAISILSRWGTRLGVMGGDSKVKTALTLKPESLKLDSGELEIVAKDAKLLFADAQYKGESFNGEIGIMKIAAQRVESLAGTVIAKAKNIYQTVEELTQLQTGRLRTLVEGAFHLKARKAVMKADEEFKVDGETIHLG